MAKTKGIVQSILQMKCPRCRKGNLFETTTFSFQKSFDMPKRCNKCNQNYEPEPGFYYGAMFISYTISGFFCLGTLGLLILGFDFSIGGAFAILLLILAILFVWFYRISRSLWIHTIIRFNEQIAKETEE